jgi:hypothetical protein
MLKMANSVGLQASLNSDPPYIVNESLGSARKKSRVGWERVEHLGDSYDYKD